MARARILVIIDFPLSNCLHSELSDVWVVQQFDPVSLTDHLANGRPGISTGPTAACSSCTRGRAREPAGTKALPTLCGATAC